MFRARFFQTYFIVKWIQIQGMVFKSVFWMIREAGFSFLFEKQTLSAHP